MAASNVSSRHAPVPPLTVAQRTISTLGSTGLSPQQCQAFSEGKSVRMSAPVRSKAKKKEEDTGKGIRLQLGTLPPWPLMIATDTARRIGQHHGDGSPKYDDEIEDQSFKYARKDDRQSWADKWSKWDLWICWSKRTVDPKIFLVYPAPVFKLVPPHSEPLGYPVRVTKCLNRIALTCSCALHRLSTPAP